MVDPIDQISYACYRDSVLSYAKEIVSIGSAVPWLQYTPVADGQTDVFTMTIADRYAEA